MDSTIPAYYPNNMKNQGEKKMENEMATGMIWGLCG